MKIKVTMNELHKRYVEFNVTNLLYSKNELEKIVIDHIIGGDDLEEGVTKTLDILEFFGLDEYSNVEIVFEKEVPEKEAYNSEIERMRHI